MYAFFCFNWIITTQNCKSANLFLLFWIISRLFMHSAHELPYGIHPSFNFIIWCSWTINWVMNLLSCSNEKWRHFFWENEWKEIPLWLLVTLIINGTQFLCWFSGVIPFNTWLISSWEENECCFKLSNWQNDDYFLSNWKLRPFWAK